MNNQNIRRQLINIRLSADQYYSILNTKCQGAKLLLDMKFKPALTSSNNIVFEAEGTQEDAEDILDWADFCCP